MLGVLHLNQHRSTLNTRRLMKNRKMKKQRSITSSTKRIGLSQRQISNQRSRRLKNRSHLRLHGVAKRTSRAKLYKKATKTG